MSHRTQTRSARGQFGSRDPSAPQPAPDRPRNVRGRFVSAEKGGLHLEDDAIHPDDAGSEDAASAIAYLLETRRSAETLHALYARTHSQRLPVHLFVSALADFASWPFLRLQVGNDIAFSDVFLHAGGLSARIWDQTSRAPLARRTRDRRLQRVDDRIRSLARRNSTAELSSLAELLEREEWFTSILTEVWTSESFGPIKAEFNLDSAVPASPSPSNSLATSVVSLVIKSWLPLVWGMHGRQENTRDPARRLAPPARLRVKLSAVADSGALERARPRRQLGVFTTRNDQGHDPWSFLVGPTGPPLLVSEQDALEMRWAGQSWSYGDADAVLPPDVAATAADPDGDSEVDTWQRAIFGPAARVNGLSKAELDAATTIDPHHFASHRLWNYDNTAAVYVFRDSDRGALKDESEVTVHYGYAGDAGL